VPHRAGRTQGVSLFSLSKK